MFKTEKEQQDIQTAKIVESVVAWLDDTRDEASELNKLELSDFAEKAGEVIFQSLDSIKSKLIDLAKLYKFNELSTDIKNTMSAPPRNASIY